MSGNVFLKVGLRSAITTAPETWYVMQPRNKIVRQEAKKNLPIAMRP